MKNVILMITTISSIILGAASVSAQVTDNMIKLKTDQFLKASVPNGVSGAVLVAKNGKIIFQNAYGMADQENGILISEDTVFDIGSNTKQFTAAAILKLAELKRLKLSDPLKKYFKDLPQDKQDITIHQLLTHSAGLIDTIGRDFDQITRAVFFKKIFASKLLYPIGTKYTYSNISYSILARIIELTSDMRYEVFLNKYLFKPADMNQTGYLLPVWKENVLANGYIRGALGQGSMAKRYKDMGKVTWHLKGNGGIHSPLGDMFKWFKALKNHQILTKTSFEKLAHGYIGPKDKRYKSGYGWGITVMEDGTKRLSHNGGNASFSQNLIWHLKEDIVIIYSTNSNSPRIESLGKVIEKIIFDENYQPQVIEKNPYFLVMDFMKNNKAEKSDMLFGLIKNKYRADFETPDILNRIGYMSLQKQADWAAEVFKMNVKLFEKDGNLWDSLGEAYAATNRKAEAIVAYKKAVELGSEGSAEKLAELIKSP